MCACITCSQIFAEILSGVRAFGISTKGWNGEDISHLKWTGKKKTDASIRVKFYIIFQRIKAHRPLKISASLVL
jgi:hypothetical protein